MNHLRVVLQVLKENQLFSKYIKYEFLLRSDIKYEFLLRSVAFLGHIISSEGVEVDPRKTKAVKICPRPLTQTNIRIFLGLVSYYWRFIYAFASIESPLTILTQKSKKFE